MKLRTSVGTAMLWSSMGWSRGRIRIDRDPSMAYTYKEEALRNILEKFGGEDGRLIPDSR